MPPPPIAALTIVVCLMLSSILLAQAPDTLWTSFYNNGREGSESCKRLIRTSDGGYLIGGENAIRGYNYFIVKTDASGVEEWQRVIDLGDNHDRFEGVAVIESGEIFTAGYFSAQEGPKSIIAKCDVNGDTLWSRRYGIGEFHDIICSSDSSVLAIGNTMEFAERGRSDAYLVNIDSEGEILWRNVYGGGGDDFSFNIERCNDGGYVLVGKANSNGLIVKTNAEGEQEWLREFSIPGSGIWFFGVAQTPDRGFIAGGMSGNSSLLVKYTADGDTVWSKRPFGDSIKDIVIAPAGGYTVVAGAYAIRFDDLGESIWTFDGTFDNQYGGFDLLTSILLDDDAGYVFGGDRYLWRGEGGNSAALVRTEPDPVVLPFELEALEESYDFGDVAVDSVENFEIKLHNFGRRYVFVDSVAFEGDTSSFSFDLELPLRIDPTDTVFIPVAFRPSTDTTYIAALTFFYGDSQSVETTLSGRGVAPGSVPPFHFSPFTFHLYAFPNPVNSSTTISFSLSSSLINPHQPSSLAIFDLSGREIARLLDTKSEIGNQKSEITWDASNQPSGIYLIRLEAAEGVKTSKVILIR